MANLKEIDAWEGCFWLAQSYHCKMVQKRRKWGNFQGYISHKLLGQFLLNLVCRVAYMYGTKYVNLIKINLVVIEIQRVENGELVVPVNNALVHHTAFLAADTRLCVLIEQ